MAPVSFSEARERVIREVRAAASTPATECVPLIEAAGRVLAADAVADRDYPPVARSARDGFAVRSSDAPGEVTVIGEVRAGELYSGEVGNGQAVEIMTGAPVPRGADAVVMVEHVTRKGCRVNIDRTVPLGEAISPQAAEACKGDVVVAAGQRLDFASIAMLATVGQSRVSVYRRPSVAILATGDEIVGVDESPREFQVRNSNAFSLAVQVQRAGGMPEMLPVARDTDESTRALVERGLASDLLLLSGGVSAGKYDIVEQVLAGCDAEFYFDRVRIQPGQPVVFGRARSTFFFGLPGNPASTMVTFEVLARPALEILSGERQPMLRLTQARLAEPFKVRAGLTRFLPATLDQGGTVTPIHWAGSGDVVSMARANAFVVTDPGQEVWQKGDWIQVLLK